MVVEVGREWEFHGEIYVYEVGGFDSWGGSFILIGSHLRLTFR